MGSCTLDESSLRVIRVKYFKILLGIKIVSYMLDHVNTPGGKGIRYNTNILALK